MASVSATELKSLREDIVCLLSNGAGSYNGPPAYSLDHVGKRLGSLQLMADTTQRETRILQQLYFRDIHAREDTIKDANEKTFNWILEPECKDGEEELWEGFHYYIRAQIGDRKNAKALLQTWLACGSGTLHLSGKAGSGKSTLMKLLYNHPRTKELLHKWAGQKTLVFVPFFFWNCGSRLQMSIGGLYRSLLYHVLAQCPALIPQVLPDQWRKVSSNPRADPSPLDIEMLRPPDIKRAFERLLETPVSLDNLRFCFFIDGLDELKGHQYEHKQLAIQLREWTKCDDIKVCVSSRPYVEFTDTFSSESRLDLHELTAADVWHLGCQMFEKDENFNRVRTTYKDLVNEIVSHAEGVLLWANVVLKTVICEVGLHSPYDRLRQKIRTMPWEMNDLYETILGYLDISDRKRAYLMLYLVLSNRMDYLEYNLTSFNWLDDITEQSFPSWKHVSQIRSLQDLHERHDSIRRQISGLTKGLLVVYERVSDEGTSRVWGECGKLNVGFSHRTVRDYLDAEPRQKYLREIFPGLNMQEVHFRLQVATLFLASRPWSMAEAEAVRGEIVWSLFDYETTLEDLRLFRDLLWPFMRPSFIGIGFYTPPFGLLREHEASFPHFASAKGLKHYVQHTMDISRSLEPQTQLHLPLASGPVQDLSFLMSLAGGIMSGREMMSMLLDAGVSTQFRLRLYRFDEAEELFVPTDRTISFWMAWVSHTAISWLLKAEADEFKDLREEFDIFELLLRSHPQEEIATISYYNGTLVTVSLREFVRLLMPSKRSLLELLPPITPDPSTWPHVKRVTDGALKDFMVRLEQDPSTSSVLLDSNTPPLGSLVAVASRTEIFQITEKLSVRVW